MRLATIFRETVASEFKELGGWIAFIAGTLAFSDPTLLDPNVVGVREGPDDPVRLLPDHRHRRIPARAGDAKDVGP